MHMCLHKGSASSSGSACHGLGAHSSPRKASGSSRNPGGWGAGRTGQFPAMPLRPPAPLSQSWHRTSEASMPVRRRVFVSLPACHRSGKWAHWAPHTLERAVAPRVPQAPRQPAAAGPVGTPPRGRPGLMPGSADTWARESAAPFPARLQHLLAAQAQGASDWCLSPHMVQPETLQWLGPECDTQIRPHCHYLVYRLWDALRRKGGGPSSWGAG